MKLEFFNAADGDTFLVTSRYYRKDRHLLVDGGRSTQFRANCLPRLGELRENRQRLEAILVSHIDADHITGILTLLEEMLEWRVFDYQRRSGNSRYPQPSSPRPPEVAKIWHNGFEAQVGGDDGLGTAVLTTMASILAASEQESLRDQAEMPAELASSIEQGVRLSRQIGEGLLDLPLNPEFEDHGGLMRVVDDPVPLPKIGKARLTLLGPTQQQLDDLAEEWAEWVADNRAKVAAIDAEAAREADRLGLGGDGLFSLRGVRASLLADAGKVTVPNLASIMLLVEEGRKSALLTGDGFGQHVIDGLAAAGELDRNGGFHTGVLKVPHHGSEFNSDRDFYSRVTADHYVISANGAHHNPDERVVDDILRSRIGQRAGDTVTRQKDDPFTIWITNTPDDESLTKSRRDHLRKVRREAKEFIGNRDQATLVFVDTPSFTIDLGED